MKINRIGKFLNKKTYFFSFFLFLIILIELIVLNKNSYFAQNKNYSVVLTENGFNPQELHIKKGDSITFTTNRNKSFWPASDLHPTHTIYPEFDPQQSIEPGKNWVFTFQKTGKWGFHDHLASLYKGKVIVSGGKVNSEIPCQNESINEKSKCWEKQLETTIKTQGLQAAFDLYANLFSSEPDFAENCHNYTHELGEASYLNFASNQDFPVTPQTAYCSYGFFHGFIEAMMQKDGSLKDAEKMCQYIDDKLRRQTDTLGACYHGIGHGVTDGSDPRTHGDPLAIIKPGLELCDQVGKDEYDHKICGTGVFNALAIMYTDPKYKLNLNRDDPFWACRQQSKNYFQHACYDDFKTLIMAITNNDFLKAARFIEEIKEDNYAKDAIDNLATYYVYYLLKNNTYSDPINKCHSLQQRLQVSCIRGLGAGFMTAGIPDQEYIRALEVCKSPLINEEESNGCYQRVIRLIQLRYDPEKYKAICQTINDKYKKYCQ